jgi:uncharacterized protein YdeI (YjbR/CyaY-like superfamily)
MNPQVDHYLAHGCGRCSLYDTPDCKVHSFTEPLIQLRRILLESGLTEEVKWSVPCYTYQGTNVIMLSAFKDYCFLSFFKGSLLKDPAGILQKAGPNSQAGRLIRFTATEEVVKQEDTLKAYIQNAKEVEDQGLTVTRTEKVPESVPDELRAKFEEDPALQQAFEALTPGRQRGYLIYFGGAKKSKTRTSRIEKYIPKIMEGKGFHDR